MKLTNSNYYGSKANLEYFSVSQYKDFLDCPARALATARGEYKPQMTEAMLIGSYIDSYFEGSLEKFKNEHPEIFNSRTGELKAAYQKANSIIKRCEADDLFMEYMTGSKQVIMTAELFGVPFKIKMDVYRKDERIVDLKIVRSLERIMGISFIEHWGYDTQMAVYSEVERIYTKRNYNLPTYLAVATKEDTTDIDIIHIPHWRREECLADVGKNMPRLIAYKNGELEAPGCGVCDYCKMNKKLKEPTEFELVGLSNREIALMKGKVW